MNGSKIAQYVTTWKRQGYPADIPDAVPDALMADCLAPSYRAICLAILSNDHSLQSLGFTPPKSAFYDALKRIEFAGKATIEQKATK
jgi:predicted phosphoadenosine phosphosulfate sulfurtransferase